MNIELKTRRIKVKTLLLLLFVVGSALCVNQLPVAGRPGPQAQTDEDLARQFFPQRLVDESAIDFAQGGPEPSQFSDFKPADLNGVGRNEFLIAAYTNGFSGAIRVLRKQGNTASLVNEPNLRLLSGIIPNIQLLDLDKDGRLEVIVSFTSARGPATDWVFKWNGSALNLIGPSTVDAHGDVSTLLSEADFLDITGDGILEIINPPQLNLDGTFDVFDLNGTRVKSLNFFGAYVRSTGSSSAITRNFSVVRTDIPYLIKVISGNSDGSNRVSSAVISLNGKVVFGPERFNQKVSQLAAVVTLQTSNTVSVELQGPPPSQIIVTIEAQP